MLVFWGRWFSFVLSLCCGQIHFSFSFVVSRSSCSSMLLSSTVFLARFSLIRIPIPPPLIFCRGFAIHLCPFMLMFLLFGNFVSVISVISIFADSSNDSMLLTFPLIPLTFMVAIDMDLFLRILFLFLYLLFSVSSCCLVLMLRLKFISLLFVFFLFFQAGMALYDCAGLSCRPAGSCCHLVFRADLPLGRVLELPLGCGFELPFGWDWELPLGRDWELPLGRDWELPLGSGWEPLPLGRGWELPLGRGWELPLRRDWELPLGRGQSLLIGRDCLVVLVLSVSLKYGLYIIGMYGPNDTCFAFWDLRHFILFYWRLVLDSMVQSADCSSSSWSYLLLRYLSFLSFPCVSVWCCAPASSLVFWRWCSGPVCSASCISGCLVPSRSASASVFFVASWFFGGWAPWAASAAVVAFWSVGGCATFPGRSIWCWWCWAVVSLFVTSGFFVWAAVFFVVFGSVWRWWWWAIVSLFLFPWFLRGAPGSSLLWWCGVSFFSFLCPFFPWWWCVSPGVLTVVWFGFILAVPVCLFGLDGYRSGCFFWSWVSLGVFG